MLDPFSYLTTLKDCGVTFFSGVPDSLLKEICACITETTGPDNHVIAANEGAAVGLSIGHYVGTGNLPLVYLQNSGLGNLVNPLLSLASSEVISGGKLTCMSVSAGDSNFSKSLFIF